MKMPVKLSNATRLALFSIALASLSTGAFAQEGGKTPGAIQALEADPLALEEEAVGSTPRDEELPRGRRKPAGEETAEAASEPARPPTEITASKETSFDEKTRKVVFLGDVVVKDPEFHITCEQLTVFLKKGGNPNGSDAPPSSGDGGLDRVIAEGKVIIFQEKSDEKGKITRYVGKASKAEYNSMTGDVTLSGWPQIQQGINNQVATEEGTVMVLNRSGRMKTIGASKTVIAESSEAPRRRDGKRPAPNGNLR